MNVTGHQPEKGGDISLDECAVYVPALVIHLIHNPDAAGNGNLVADRRRLDDGAQLFGAGTDRVFDIFLKHRIEFVLTDNALPGQAENEPSLFCALQDGLNAVGLDRDERAIHEAAEYFARYLKYHQLKHTRRARSETLRRGSLPVTEFLFSSDKEHYLAGDTRQLTLSTGDTEWSPALFRKKTADVIVADLPYGIQHAPQGSQRTETFQALLSRSLPAWRQALRADGALVISFNTYTLPTRTVQESLRRAGWTVCDQPPLTGLQHEVEQAVVRDVVFAINNKGGSPHDSE